MDLELSGKVAIVTGGSRGIGKAIARELAREGATVAIVARGQAALEQAADEIATETGSRVLPIPADVSDAAAVGRMVDQAVDALGGVQILVNSGASVGSRVAFKLPDVTGDAYWGEMNIKVRGALYCIQQVAPHMIAQRWGRIITISGMAGRKPNSIIGSTRNVALVAMTKNAAEELGPYGINVTVVHPGATVTEYYSQQLDDLAEQQGVPREDLLRERFAANLIRTPVVPQNIAHVVAFLASPKSVAINGDVVPTEGGTPGVIFY